MDKYITGTAIKQLREAQNLTQAEIADLLGVSPKTVSKWETGRGYPDITLIEPLATALKVSVAELLSGQTVSNKNTSSNILRSKLYVCPICGNILFGMGDAAISCDGITLPPLEAEVPDEIHNIKIENVEDELFVTVDHAMTKEHHISFLLAMTDCGILLHKLYPESDCVARFKKSRVKFVFAYCNKHGLFKIKV